MTLFRLLCFGLVIHMIFLFSIFDIYFKSPILSDVLPEENKVYPPGKRVVFISVDGLRFDSLFDRDPVTGKYVAGFMQDVIENRGSWGISQSHVPTESRPGHVAMLAGFYEDPSAVTRGWKENPVDFDSIFNRSYCTFAWGSPDIINIFFKGLKHKCAFVESYKNEQNFAGDTREYDNWVFEKLMAFLKFSSKSRALYNQGLFFFLHLLGQDTSGHKDKPHTVKYRQNLKNVDEITERVENAFYDFYGDDKTTFIFTSDHGMTNWGSHGAGDPDETNTPFVAWGAGIRKPTSSYSKPININQADITPLLAILLGSSIPVNSIGILPVPYLNMSKRQIAEATLLNAKQIAALYLKALHNTKNHIISMFHVPFKGLLIDDLQSAVWSITNLIALEKYSEAIRDSQLLIKLGLEGLNYYQNYYQRPLLFCISLSYLAWIFYLLFELIDDELSSKNFKNSELKLIFGIVIFFTFIFILYQKLPISFYCYALLPEFLWYFVIKKLLSLRSSLKHLSKRKFMYFFFSIMLGVEVLVISFFKKWLLSISLVLILGWSVKYINFKSARLLMCLWLLSGCGLGIFSILPPFKGQPNPIMTISSVCTLFVFLVIAFKKVNQTSSFVFLLRFIPLLIAAWNNYQVHSHFNEHEELPPLNQYISWCLMFVSIILVFFKLKNAFERLCHIYMSLSIPFSLLSISNECYFLTFLLLHLFCWIFIESSLKTQRRGISNIKMAFWTVRNQNQTIRDFRIAYFFLSYIFLSFFGLGNTTSLNSFDPAWVRCFVTVFSPFLMSALILLKTVIPFLIVTCTMRTMTVVLNIHPGRLFIIVLIYSNIMGLNFLFLIRNKGSWLDIGTSISHYVIQQVTIVFLVLLFGIAKLLTAFPPPPPPPPPPPFSKEEGEHSNDVSIQFCNISNPSFSLPLHVVPLKVHKA